jgi:hypothetical protein
MARTSSQTKKQEDLPQIQITLTRSVDWVAYEADHPALAGRTYIGRNEAEALTHAAADISDHFRGKAKVTNVRVVD